VDDEHAAWHIQVRPIEPGLIAEYDLRVRDGVPIIASVRVVATTPGLHYVAGEDLPPGAPITGDGVTARALRRVPVNLHDLVAEALRPHRVEWLNDTAFRRTIRMAPRKPGRRGRSDLFYAQLAQRYVETAKTSSSPVADLAKALSTRRRTIDRDWVSDQIRVARRRGLLSDPPRGRAGGQLTERALELLKRGEPPQN
jgi:hypothetical protein